MSKEGQEKLGELGKAEISLRIHFLAVGEAREPAPSSNPGLRDGTFDTDSSFSSLEETSVFPSLVSLPQREGGRERERDRQTDRQRRLRRA